MRQSEATSEEASLPAIEDDYLDVLQNIEFAIVSVYRQQPELLDAEVEKALNAVLREYQAEKQQRAARAPTLGGLPEMVYAGLKHMCEWRPAAWRTALTSAAVSASQVPSLRQRRSWVYTVGHGGKHLHHRRCVSCGRLRQAQPFRTL